MLLSTFKKNISILLETVVTQEQLEVIFSGRISFDDFVTQVLFEKYKEEYLRNSPTNPLLSYVKKDKNWGEGEEAEYQKKKRTLDYANKEKLKLIEELTDEGIDTTAISGLEIHVTNTLDEKLKGLSLSSQHIRQLKTIEDFRILKAIASRRITNVKLLKNPDLKAMYREFDNYYESMVDSVNNEEYFPQLINFYDIERTYLIELMYRIATHMEEEQISLKDFKIESLAWLFKIKVKNISIENRFLYRRHDYIRELLNNNPITNMELEYILFLKAALFKYCKEQIDSSYNDLKQIHVEDHLRSNYNLLDYHTNNKEWTNKKIRIIRLLYNELIKKR